MAASLSPTQLPQRVDSVDVLRGVAVLGILTMNIVAFGLPGQSYINPMHDGANVFAGAFAGANKAVWWVTHLLADQKFMAIFSMLFGAGVVLQDSRARNAAAEGEKPGFASIYYRRLLWLFVIGMLHAYLVWYGDILVAYSICGLLLYPMRRMRWGWLVGIGSAVLLMAVLIQVGMGAALKHLEGQADHAQAIVQAGGQPTREQLAVVDRWTEVQTNMAESPEEISTQVLSVRSGYQGVLGYNASNSLALQTFFFAIWTLWRGLGCMLLGMGLAKLGLLTNARTRRFYVVLAILGYAIGFPLAYLGGIRQIEHKFDMVQAMLIDWHFNYVGSVAVGLGHVAVVLLLIRRSDVQAVSEPDRRPPALGPVGSRLAAVGRMPLTNYLAQSVICTFVFFGWGLGQLGHWTRAEIYVLVPVVWAAILLWSPWWLARYRFGPVEWLWRSLSYWKRQPMRMRTECE